MPEIAGEKEALRRLYAALNSPWKAGPKWATYQRQTVEAALDVIKQLHDAAPPPARQLPSVIEEIAAERRRQIEVEGWTPEHDDQHRDYALACAAGCYAMYTIAFPAGNPPQPWPWDKAWWKPSPDKRRNWIKAAALLVAEIERADRMAAPQPKKGGEK